MNCQFNAKEAKDECIKWIQNWFKHNGNGCNCFVGISGGKDSAVVASLCVEALGKKRVVGVIMPDGEQEDLKDAIKLAKKLGIYHFVADIGAAVEGVFDGLVKDRKIIISVQAENNLLARIRMATLYTASQSMNGRVANTTNGSKLFVGDSVIWGSDVGDFAPIATFTTTEVIAIGNELGISAKIMEKPSLDDTGIRSYEERFGFSSQDLDTYIRTGKLTNQNISNRIEKISKQNMFKTCPIPAFHYKKK